MSEGGTNVPCRRTTVLSGQSIEALRAFQRISNMGGLRTVCERFANILRGAARFCACKPAAAAVSALLCTWSMAYTWDASALPAATAGRPRPRQSVPSVFLLRNGRRCAAEVSAAFQRLLCTHAQILEERSGKLLSIIVPLKAKVRPHYTATTDSVSLLQRDFVRHGPHTVLGARRYQGAIGY